MILLRRRDALRVNIIEDRSVACSVCKKRRPMYAELDRGGRICLRCTKAVIRLMARVRRHAITRRIEKLQAVLRRKA